MQKQKLLLLSFILALSSLYSRDNYDKSDSYLKTHYATFGLSNLVNSKLKFQTIVVALNSKHTYSPEINIGYIFDFSQKWYYQNKLSFGVTPYNFNYNIYLEESSLFRNADYPFENIDNNFTEYNFGLYLSLDAALHRKINVKNNFLTIGFGLRATRYMQGYNIHEYVDKRYVNENNPYQLFFLGRLDNLNTKLMNFSAFSDFGYVIKLKRENLVKFSFIYNLAFFNRIEGNYFFTERGDIYDGNMHHKPSFYGFSIEYQLFGNKLYTKRRS